jgi:hypothetical protein
MTMSHSGMTKHLLLLWPEAQNVPSGAAGSLGKST